MGGGGQSNRGSCVIGAGDGRLNDPNANKQQMDAAHAQRRNCSGGGGCIAIARTGGPDWGIGVGLSSIDR